MSKDQTERLLELMAFSAAPISQTSILDELDVVESEDITPNVFLEELELVERFAARGLHSFSRTLRTALDSRKHQDEQDQSSMLDNGNSDTDYALPPAGKYDDRTAVALNLTAYLLPFYLKRLARLSTAIGRVADSCRKHHFGDITVEATDELRRLTTMIEAGSRPKHVGNLQDVCDLTRGVKWDVPDLKLPQGKVGFKETAIELADGEKVEAPLRTGFGAAQYSRRKGRNPTGFTKFNFADLEAMQADEEAEGDIVPETPTSERGGGSSRLGVSSSLRRDSSDVSRESFNISRQHSSIDENPVEIDDKFSDPQWSDQQRKKSREQRVRRRIPTGHPNMMKNALVARASLELHEDNEDEETKLNTELNERIV